MVLLLFFLLVMSIDEGRQEQCQLRHKKHEDEHGKLIGEFKSSGLRPNFTRQAAYFGLDKALLELV